MLRSEPRLDPAVRDELDALDAALRGDAAPVADARDDAAGDDAAGLEALVADVRATRPTLDADARTRLEARADEQREGRARSGAERAGRRRRLVVAVAAVAAVAIPVGGVALSSLEPDHRGEYASGTAGDALEETSLEPQSREAGPEAASRTAADPPASAADAASGAGSSRSSSGPRSSSGASASSGAAPAPGGDAASGADSSSSSGAGSGTGVATGAASGPRRVVRAVRQTVRVAPDGVARAAARVGTIAQDADGYVADSTVRERGRAAGGRFEVVVPTGRLNATVAALGRIGTPVRLDRSSLDVTARAAGLDDRLADARADRAALRLQLARTVDAARRAARRRELRLLTARVARLEAQRDELRGRTSTARIVLRLTTAAASADAPPPAVDDGRWGLDDAWGDATRVLEVTAGVVLVGAIALLPLGLALAGLGLLRRRSAAARRERVIDAS